MREDYYLLLIVETKIVPSFTTPQLLNIAYIFLLFLRANLPQKGCSRLADKKVSHFQYYSYAIQVDRCLLLNFFFGALRVPTRTRILLGGLQLGVGAYRTRQRTDEFRRHNSILSPRLSNLSMRLKRLLARRLVESQLTVSGYLERHTVMTAFKSGIRI